MPGVNPGLSGVFGTGAGSLSPDFEAILRAEVVEVGLRYFGKVVSWLPKTGIVRVLYCPHQEVRSVSKTLPSESL